MPSVLFYRLSIVLFVLSTLCVGLNASPLPPKPKYTRWPNNVIPYVISDEYSDRQRKTILNALNDFENQTGCFTFVEKVDGDQDWIHFANLGSCWSFHGCQGGKQNLSLDDYCLTPDTIQHEMMHAIGIDHEHQRPDRDNYVKVNMDNVRPNEAHFFDINSHDELHDAGFSYDIHSIMHYSGYASGSHNLFGNQLVTMEDKSTNKPVPYNTKLTDLDIEKIRWIGQCKKFLKCVVID